MTAESPMLRPGHSANFWKRLSSKHLAAFVGTSAASAKAFNLSYTFSNCCCY